MSRESRDGLGELGGGMSLLPYSVRPRGSVCGPTNSFCGVKGRDGRACAPITHYNSTKLCSRMAVMSRETLSSRNLLMLDK
jgi:hypothetical protein